MIIFKILERLFYCAAIAFISAWLGQMLADSELASMRATGGVIMARDIYETAIFGKLLGCIMFVLAGVVFFLLFPPKRK